MSAVQSSEPPPELAGGLAPLYTEAMAVADASPASACALLRLLAQAMLRGAGRSGRNLKRDVDDLVADGADMGVLRALDVVGLTESELRRPGELSLANGHSDVQNMVVFVHLLARALV